LVKHADQAEPVKPACLNVDLCRNAPRVPPVAGAFDASHTPEGKFPGFNQTPRHGYSAMVANVGTSSGNLPVPAWHKPPSFAELDSDGNGSLSPAELKRAASLLDSTSGPATPPALFKELDTNRDGTISPQEYAAYEANLSAPTQSLVLQTQQDNSSAPAAQWASAQYGVASALSADPPGSSLAVAA
jgi:EF-hand domain pair